MFYSQLHCLRESGFFNKINPEKIIVGYTYVYCSKYCKAESVYSVYVVLRHVVASHVLF